PILSETALRPDAEDRLPLRRLPEVCLETIILFEACTEGHPCDEEPPQCRRASLFEAPFGSSYGRLIIFSPAPKVLPSAEEDPFAPKHLRMFLQVKVPSPRTSE